MYGIEFEALKNFVSNTTILFVYLVPKGMCKPKYSNKDFFPLANVIIKKTPLHNGNSSIKSPITELGVGHAFEPGQCRVNMNSMICDFCSFIKV